MELNTMWRCKPFRAGMADDKWIYELNDTKLTRGKETWHDGWHLKTWCDSRCSGSDMHPQHNMRQMHMTCSVCTNANLKRNKTWPTRMFTHRWTLGTNTWSFEQTILPSRLAPPRDTRIIDHLRLKTQPNIQTIPRHRKQLTAYIHFAFTSAKSPHTQSRSAAHALAFQ